METKTNVTNQEVEDLFNDIKDRYNFTFQLKREQTEIVKNVMNKIDSFALLPTGYGKSACYILPPLLITQKTGVHCTALIITPLKTLMDNQVTELRARGIAAAGLKQGMSDAQMEEVMSGAVTHLFAIPEALLQPKWRKVLLKLYGKKIVSQTYDEAHTVSEWGLDFRPTYRQVTSVTSLIDAPVLAVTATATKAVYEDVVSSLCLKHNSKTISIIPDRPNIFLDIHSVTENHSVALSWIVDHLKLKGVNSKKIIIYTNSVKACHTIFHFFREELGNGAYADKTPSRVKTLIEMFHAATPDEVKETIMGMFTTTESTIRVLVATLAVGMGVNINDVDVIVNWGLPKTAMLYWQESGRCGRDGRDGINVCYAYKRSINLCQDECLKKMLEKSSCLRLQILSNFVIGSSTQDDMDAYAAEKDKCKGCSESYCRCAMCLCCSNCFAQCSCCKRAKEPLQKYLT